MRTIDADLPEQSPVREPLAGLGAELIEAVDELREVSRGIHPSVLTDGGLGPALRALARRSAVPVELDLHVDTRLPPTVEAAAYYVAAESLTNVAKHADATFVQLSASVQADRLLVTLHDDGVGGADASSGSGLIGLIDRVEALGGTFVCDSPTGMGTTVRIDIPLGTSDE